VPPFAASGGHLMKSVLVRCVAPERRDALEETARLALSFITLASGPDFPEFQSRRDLEVHLSVESLVEGCHLPDTAQELLEAVQAFGVSIKKVVSASVDVGEEWQAWWKTLDFATDRTFDLELEIR
jgi:hypothetical protein